MTQPTPMERQDAEHQPEIEWATKRELQTHEPGRQDECAQADSKYLQGFVKS